MALTQSNTLATLNGLFKQVYGDNVENLIPAGEELMKDIPFVKSDKRLGAKYNQPVIVGQELGFSYGGTDGTAFNLNDAVPGQVKNAEVESYEFVLRTSISVGAVSRSLNDKAAFERSTKLVVANMVQSFAKRLECIMFYGQLDIGVVSAVATTDFQGNALPGSQRKLTLSSASWAPGIWSGGINMMLSIWDASSSFADLDSAGFDVKGVNIDGKQIIVEENTSGTAATIQVSDPITHFGAGYYQNAGGSLEFAGLQKIMSNSGLLFAINASQYDLWKSTSYNVAGALSFPKIQKAISLAMAKGLKDDLLVYVNPSVWENLITDEAAQRRLDSSYDAKTTEKGSEKIVFYGQNGKITIRPNIYVKEGVAFCIPEPVKKTLMRVGSTEVTFEMPGYQGEFFRLLENKNGYELRAYADMALFCWQPNKLILLTGITVS